jgi:hypothetical protein
VRWMPSASPSAGPLVTPRAVPSDDGGREGQGDLVDDPGGQGRGEQAGAALAQDLTEPALGEGVQCTREVDVGTSGDEHGIRTEHAASTLQGALTS